MKEKTCVPCTPCRFPFPCPSFIFVVFLGLHRVGVVRTLDASSAVLDVAWRDSGGGVVDIVGGGG